MEHEAASTLSRPTRALPTASSIAVIISALLSRIDALEAERFEFVDVVASRDDLDCSEAG